MIGGPPTTEKASAHDIDTHQFIGNREGGWIVIIQNTIRASFKNKNILKCKTELGNL